ncbi:Fpg/Nei family DNA glycosylase [Hymenobacter sp. BT730]|uniref:Fpg/Nei family DNA glycosylase n=1 Tax=Hymenobacter sp. BT730 TaxID=3063332 RepID=UPI0026E0A74D|nr:DNA-formamidopyrimidine glycosylase family protein [Hymenobacter sp. BT730]
MPELPEVETYRRLLEELLVSQSIVAFEVLDAHVLATPEEELRQALVGSTVTDTSRLGKNCFLELSTGQLLVLHFGMTGDIGAYRHDHDRPRFTRVALHLNNDLRVAFIDPRKFGRIRLASSIQAFQTEKKLGPDALDITAEELQQRLGMRKQAIKPLLLQQNIAAGLGNWIVDEVLFQARIHPERPANSLSIEHFGALYNAVQLVLTTAIRHEAVYRYFPASFLIHAREWDNSPTPETANHLNCPIHKEAVIEKTYVGGRATYTCPLCQPRYNQ